MLFCLKRKYSEILKLSFSWTANNIKGKEGKQIVKVKIRC